VSSLNDSEKGFIVSGQRLRTLGFYITTMLPVTLPYPWTNFWPKHISLVPQPPYSPDLSPCDFFLFPKLKFHLKGHHFGTVDNIWKVVKDQPRALLHEDFQHCYRQWEQHLRRCVASQGNCFEGDNVDLYVNVKQNNIAPVSLLSWRTFYVVSRPQYVDFQVFKYCLIFPLKCSGRTIYYIYIYIYIFVVPCVVILVWRNPTRCNCMKIIIYC